MKKGKNLISITYQLYLMKINYLLKNKIYFKFNIRNFKNSKGNKERKRKRNKNKGNITNSLIVLKKIYKAMNKSKSNKQHYNSAQGKNTGNRRQLPQKDNPNIQMNNFLNRTLNVTQIEQANLKNQISKRKYSALKSNREKNGNRLSKWSVIKSKRIKRAAGK